MSTFESMRAQVFSIISTTEIVPGCQPEVHPPIRWTYKMLCLMKNTR